MGDQKEDIEVGVSLLTLCVSLFAVPGKAAQMPTSEEITKESGMSCLRTFRA